MVTFRLPDLLLVFFFRGLPIVSGQFSAVGVEHLWLEAEHLETKDLQQVEFAVVRSKAKGLYDILQGP